MKIALYQGPGHINNIPAAFGHMEARAREAKAQGADLLILPEMYLSGYNIGPEAALAQAITAEDLAPARQIARETGVRVVSDLYTHSPSPADGPAPTYLDMIRYNTLAIVEALR